MTVLNMQFSGVTVKRLPVEIPVWFIAFYTTDTSRI